MPEFGPLTCKQLNKFRDLDRRRLAEFAEVLSNHTGYTTPAEEFIVNIVNFHVYGKRGLTPQIVHEKLKEFESDFTEAISLARRFARLYPDLVLEKPAPVEEGEVA